MKDYNQASSVNGFDFTIDDSTLETSKQETQKSESEQISQPVISAPTKAQPQIPQDTAPFIVLCGPPASGKSMVLKSLASYLYQSGLGYTIEANTTLLNTAKYQEDCRYFNDIIGNSNTRMPNTVDYLMADIVDKQGDVVAHFLEAPGEDFFSLKDSDGEPNLPFKGYLTKVAQTVSEKQLRKVIYIILLDLDSTTSFRSNMNLRRKYEQKMLKLYNQFILHHPSRVILLYNKVDIPRGGLWANSNNCSNIKAVVSDAKMNYPNLFFTKKVLFWDIENYSFLPFCTGSYPDDGSYTASGPAYPSALWKEIMKHW